MPRSSQRRPTGGLCLLELFLATPLALSELPQLVRARLCCQRYDGFGPTLDYPCSGRYFQKQHADACECGADGQDGSWASLFGPEDDEGGSNGYYGTMQPERWTQLGFLYSFGRRNGACAYRGCFGDSRRSDHWLLRRWSLSAWNRCCRRLLGTQAQDGAKVGRGQD